MDRVDWKVSDLDTLWVEIGNKVLDYSNGNKVTMPKKAYYALGRVNPNECKYYKYKKAAQFMLNEVTMDHGRCLVIL